MRNWKKFLQADKNKSLIFLAAITLFVMAAILSICCGVANLTFAQLMNAMIEGPGSSVEGNIFWYVRIPRTMACIFAGAGFAVSGTVIQSILANKLASPGIIGVNAGAGFAVTMCCIWGTISGWAVAGSAFVGAFAAVMLVTLVAQKTKASRTTVILGGVAVNSFLSACSEAVVTLFPDVGVLTADFRVGGFASATTSIVLPAGILIIAGIIILLTFCNELDLMVLGEETAQGLGLPVKRMRSIFLMLAALLAGASVSFAGLLGFVGLIIPNVARKLVGSESRYLLTFCALFGATFVTLCDTAARLVFQPYEMPTGVLMSFIGGPFFVFLLLKNKGGHGHG